MYTLNLNNMERDTLIQTLKSDLVNLNHEIARTDSRSFRDELKMRRAILEKIASSLNPKPYRPENFGNEAFVPM